MKAIYMPKGKAQEYAKYACNFYVGCSNNCSYCYLKCGIGKATLGGNEPRLKTCFTTQVDAFECFKGDILKNKEELQEHGVFFSFTTDPMLEEIRSLTIVSAFFAAKNGVTVKILTKRADFIDRLSVSLKRVSTKNKIAFGFTLTGHDELEPNASPNLERIEALKKLKSYGFNTFVSCEPMIDIESTTDMIVRSAEYADLIKVGLLAGAKYNKLELRTFVFLAADTFKNNKFYFKDTLIKKAGIERSELPDNCVNADYNMFK